jgi:hypothetical protein
MGGGIGGGIGGGMGGGKMGTISFFFMRSYIFR